MLNVWQIGAGDEEKDFVPIMIEKGVMIIGPGNRPVGDISKDNKELDARCLERFAKTDFPLTPKQAHRLAKRLEAFRDANEGEIVILRLGSVCFAAGAIIGKYEWREEFGEVISYWNENRKYNLKEDGWDLQHTRKVVWFALKDEEALYCFRRGIYTRIAFSKINDETLHKYLEKKGYDGKNGKEILNIIGDTTSCVNEYGFPIGKRKSKDLK